MPFCVAQRCANHIVASIHGTLVHRAPLVAMLQIALLRCKFVVCLWHGNATARQHRVMWSNNLCYTRKCFTLRINASSSSICSKKTQLASFYAKCFERCRNGAVLRYACSTTFLMSRCNAGNFVIRIQRINKWKHAILLCYPRIWRNKSTRTHGQDFYHFLPRIPTQQVSNGKGRCFWHKRSTQK